jgi:Putative esterase
VKYVCPALILFEIMSVRILLFIGLLLAIINADAQMDHPLPLHNGKIVTIDSFPSRYIDPRNIFVWLPEDYTRLKHYAVVYMHDGQMLFDSATTWTQQEWKVDETMTRMLREHSIRDAIVVGIPNHGIYRWAEYLPQAILDSLPVNTRDQLIKTWFAGRPLGDAYLKFMVHELKPYIDSTYATLSDPSNTFTMGSSMGGIISLYAICEYPEVFGGAGCLSTHWPLGIPGIMLQKNAIDIPAVFRDYLRTNLPSPETHRIYFDYGTETLDALYKPHQDLVDAIMVSKGYTAENWITREFPGEDHTERAWAKRLHIPLQFLLGPR